MPFRSLLVLSALFVTGPVFAEVAPSKEAQNAANWEVFQKLYPARAIAAKEEGAVGFLVTIDSKGYVTQCKVTHSSGHPLLDEETCNLITLHAEFKPSPGGSVSQSRTSEGMIAWKLPTSSTALTAPKAIASSELDTVICKKSIRTGTLGGVERTCMTRREWGRQADDMKQTWDEVQGRKGSTHGN